jgi:hypothetical protein
MKNTEDKPRDIKAIERSDECVTRDLEQRQTIYNRSNI